jgi:PIN domain nuclease of toxin-antitoxin system
VGGRGGAAALPAAVTDTHPLVYLAGGGRGLSPRAAKFFDQCERQQAVVYVPAAVIWECALLARVARINLRRTVREFFADLFSNPAYQPIDLTPEQVFTADDLRFSRDPFDTLICAAARTLDLPLLTRDGVIRGSGAVKIIW